MKAKLKRWIDKLFMRDVIFEIRHEMGLLRADLAQNRQALCGLEAELRQMRDSLQLLHQDVTSGHEALADQILEGRREIALELQQPEDRAQTLHRPER